jgi:hypothetical protein
MNANDNLQVDEGAKTSVELATLPITATTESLFILAKNSLGKPDFVRIVSINRI